MSRRHAWAVLAHLAALLPHAVPDSLDDETVERWGVGLSGLDLAAEGDMEDLTTVLDQLATNWDSPAWPSPIVVSGQVRNLRMERTRQSAVAAARAAIAGSNVPSIDGVPR